MSQTPLYPLRFEPIYQYRLWGGRRLASLLTAPLPGDGPIGEAWVLSDREQPSEPCCRWIAQRADHRSSAGAISGTGNGKIRRAFSPLPACC